ncbi:MAG: 3-hydroxyacyl-CoA dehydrogenase NAD-binding domain-containing protein [Bdellovibrionota bacterium]
MGNGIAHVAAQHGFQVILSDIDQHRVEAGLKTITTNLDRMLAKEKSLREQKDSTLSKIQITTDLEQMKNAQLVVEAATENVALKLDLFKRLDEITPKETILASNTSSISITKIASATRKPENVIGMHFMNPVPIMKLVEVIRGHLTLKKRTKPHWPFPKPWAKPP